MHRRPLFQVLGTLIGLSLTQVSGAQFVCDVQGPDAAIGFFPSPANYLSLNGVEAFSVGATICNLGNQPLSMVAGPSTQHSVMAQQLYRFSTVNGSPRFEQIGMSWVFHTFSVLSQQLCCTDCVPVDFQHLGARCACPESSTIMGGQGILGPRWQVNASTGVAVQPLANPPFAGSIDRRLQAKIVDIDAALNPGASYFVEVVVLGPDDAAAGNDDNNASFRRVSITGSGAAYNLALADTLQGGAPAIEAWKAADPSVVKTNIDIPGDGRLILAAKATAIGRNLWRYEYALYNLNSDRAARSFSIPIPANATITNIGFHDVDYHSGDGIGNINTDGTDWSATVDSSSVTWSTQTFAQNPNANALRWGTLYNFRFDADIPPAANPGEATIGAFKVEGSAAALTVVPQLLNQCPADIAPEAGDGVVDVSDLLAVINNWAQGASNPADINGDAIVDVSDLLAVINAWGACE